jgi:hypothetical protein
MRKRRERWENASDRVRSSDIEHVHQGERYKHDYHVDLGHNDRAEDMTKSESLIVNEYRSWRGEVVST